VDGCCAPRLPDDFAHAKCCVAQPQLKHPSQPHAWRGATTGINAGLPMTNGTFVDRSQYFYWLLFPSANASERLETAHCVINIAKHSAFLKSNMRLDFFLLPCIRLAVGEPL
jgi:hypothetical protein